MSSGTSRRRQDGGGTPLPEVDILLDEGVNRALAGAGFANIVLRVSVHAITPLAQVPTDPDEFDAGIDAFLAERALAHAHLDIEIATVILQAEMLEAFEVPRGDKSIAIFMHRAWTPSRAARHGRALAPATLRHWRSRLRARASREKGRAADADCGEAAGPY